jgi:multidrug transporter EmrE-like cation transporter
MSIKWIMLYASVFFNVLTNIGFKISAINEAVPVKKWGYFSVALLFGLLNSILFTESLTGKEISLQVGSAIYFPVTVLGLFLAGHFMFQEHITPWQVLGGALILTGVVIISLK